MLAMSSSPKMSDDAQAHGGIEAPEQQSGDHRVGQQVPGEQGALALVLRRRVRDRMMVPDLSSSG